VIDRLGVITSKQIEKGEEILKELYGYFENGMAAEYCAVFLFHFRFSFIRFSSLFVSVSEDD
jgi:hypothetical protein